MKTDRIEAIRNQIAIKIERGEDYSNLTRQLAQERAKRAVQVEVEQIQRTVDKRKALKDKAETIKLKIQKQNETIDAFLKARDTITTALLPILEKAKDLPGLHEKCFEEFHDSMMAGHYIREAGGFLPADLTISMLQLGNGTRDAYDISQEALAYLSSACGLLANLQKVEIKPAQPSIDSELNFGNNGADTIEGKCLVCLHPEVETINKQLTEGKPLRDLEAEYHVSRSTLSRHKNKCLNQGAIQFIAEPESPTASANQTYFQ